MTGRTARIRQGWPESAGETVALVKAAAAGDRIAFHRLVDQYHAAVFRLVWFRTRSRPDAEDLTQEVFLTAWRRLPRLRDPRRFRSWLVSVALNRVRDFGRKRRLRTLFFAAMPKGPPPQATSAAPEAPRRLERSDFWRQVTAVVDRLPRREREVFVLRFFDELSLPEIARALDRSPSTVKTHLYRAVAKIRRDPDAAALLEEERF